MFSSGSIIKRSALIAGVATFFSCSIRNPVLSYATVLQPVKGLRGCMLQYQEANGKTRFIHGPYQPGFVKGEKFLFVFDSLQPKKHNLLNEFPLFEPTEKTDITYGKITRCISSSSFSRVSFRYEVKGKKYRKKQWIPGLRFMKYGSACQVEYWAANPARAILKQKIN
jgi:hypothetical protein